VVVSDDQRVGGVRSFLPAVEGMRACAAMGVVVTHVAFQTGHSSGVDGRLFGRFDLAVDMPRRHGIWRRAPAPAITCGPGWSASCPPTWWRSW
jgi:hypothetical protein